MRLRGTLPNRLVTGPVSYATVLMLERVTLLWVAKRRRHNELYACQLRKFPDPGCLTVRGRRP